jgi:hypothetical protein
MFNTRMAMMKTLMAMSAAMEFLGIESFSRLYPSRPPPPRGEWSRLHGRRAGDEITKQPTGYQESQDALS